MIELDKLLVWLKKFPVWLRAIVVALIAALVLIASMSMSACGQTVRVTVKDTPSGVSVTTSQNRSDSTNTSINVNPTINIPSRYEKSQ